jgi:hypothetical protein
LYCIPNKKLEADAPHNTHITRPFKSDSQQIKKHDAHQARQLCLERCLCSPTRAFEDMVVPRHLKDKKSSPCDICEL